MKAKRWIALVLFLALLVGLVPVNAFSAAAAETTSETETAVTEPLETEPVVTEPLETEPVVTEPLEAESETAEPTVTEPTATETEETEPVQVMPVSETPEDDAISLSVGEYQSVMLAEGGQSAWFSFVPYHTGCYTFVAEAEHVLHVAAYDSADQLIIDGESAGEVHLSAVLKEDHEYRIFVVFADEADTGTVWAHIQKEINLADTGYYGGGAAAGRPACFTYTPEASSYYAIYVESDEEMTVSLYDEDNRCLKTVSGSGVVCVGYENIAWSTYMIQISTKSEDWCGFEIDLVRHRELKEGTWVDTEIDNYVDEAGFVFTPESTGIYTINSVAEEWTNAVICDLNGIQLAYGEKSPYRNAPYFVCPLTAGEQYLLTIEFQSSYDVGPISVQAERLPEFGGNIGVAEIQNPGDSKLYAFSPEKTDRYIFETKSELAAYQRIESPYGDFLEPEYVSDTKNAYILLEGEQYILEVGLSYSDQTGKVYFSIVEGHAFENAEEVPPSCTEEGLRTFTCTYCQELIREVIPATHEYDNGACVHCGKLYIVKLKQGHNSYQPWNSDWVIDKAYYSYTPEYTESYTFKSSAGDTVGYLYNAEGTLLTSNDDDEEGNTDFSITWTLEAGKTYYLVSEYYLESINSEAMVHLSVNHDYETVTVPETCTKNGSKTSVCRICGHRSVEILYSEHTWDEGAVTEEYSCEVEGTVLYTCTICGETRTEWKGGYGHSYYKGAFCERCGKVMEDEGTCGDNLTWKIDDTQTLTISGTGDMYDYESWGNESPWDEYAPSILTVIIEEGVTSIGEYAFSSCYALKTVNLPKTLKRIEDGAFEGPELERIVIPANVEYISPAALSTNHLQIDENNPYYSADETGELYSKDGTVLYAVLKNHQGAYRIPDGVVTIAGNAPQGDIRCLTIPDSVQCIEGSIAESMDYEPIILFEGDAPTFADNVFAAEYEWDCFDGKVYYPGDNETWTEDVLQNYGGYPQWMPISDMLATGSCGESLEWSLGRDGTLTITGNGPMYNFGWEWLEKGEENYTQCPWEEFKYLIRNVVLTQGITRIGQQAFADCIALQTANIPNTVTHIGSEAFQNCESLLEIDIPDSVQYLEGTGIFLDCSSLVRARLPEGITFIPDTMFGRCYSLKEVNIPDSVTRIEPVAFSSCYSLEKVTLPENVTYIGDWAFQHCTSLKEINIPSKVKVIDSKAFRDCPGLTEIHLPEGLVSIADGAFYYCTGLTELKLPSTVQKIGWGAFSGCTGLTEMVIPEGVSYLGGTFWECTGLTKVTIPDTVTNIGYWAFRSCTSLKELKLPEKLEFIGDGVFANSTVSAITFTSDAPAFAVPSTVTGGAYRAFSDSTVLAAMEMPESLQALSAEDASTFAVTYPYGNNHEGTFGGVTAAAYYPADNTTWTEHVLNGNYGGNITWVPFGAVKNRITMPSADLAGQTSVWVDGKEYAVYSNGDVCYIDLPDGKAHTMTAYTWHIQDPNDVHTQYPVSMKVWTLRNEDGIYQATREEAFDDILQYSGMSIRVYGRKGIRMITSIEQEKKNALINDGLAGYRLKEYGTIVAWANQLSDTKPLVLGKSYVKSNYAYKRGIADPVFQYRGNLMQYTNVLVNFSDAQCADDLAMRPYMILEDAQGNVITLYGGIVRRSIGYIAYRNRNVFEPGSDEYEYVWDIIHTVYGTAYDDDYRIAWTPPIM